MLQPRAYLSKEYNTFLKQVNTVLSFKGTTLIKFFSIKSFTAYIVVLLCKRSLVRFPLTGIGFSKINFITYTYITAIVPFLFVTVHKPQDEQIRFYIDLLNETNLVIDEQGII